MGVSYKACFLVSRKYVFHIYFLFLVRRLPLEPFAFGRCCEDILRPRARANFTLVDVPYIGSRHFSTLNVKVDCVYEHHTVPLPVYKTGALLFFIDLPFARLRCRAHTSFSSHNILKNAT